MEDKKLIKSPKQIIKDLSYWFHLAQEDSSIVYTPTYDEVIELIKEAQNNAIEVTTYNIATEQYNKDLETVDQLLPTVKDIPVEEANLYLASDRISKYESKYYE